MLLFQGLLPAFSLKFFTALYVMPFLFVSLTDAYFWDSAHTEERTWNFCYTEGETTGMEIPDQTLAKKRR